MIKVLNIKYYLIILIHLVSLSAFSREINGELSIGVDDEPATVYNLPGYNWKNCVKPCEAVGWLKPDDSKFTLNMNQSGDFDKIVKDLKNPTTGKSEKVTFYNIKFTYTRNTPSGFLAVKKDVPGFMAEDYIKIREDFSFKSPTDAIESIPCKKDKLEDLKSVVKALETNYSESISEICKGLSGVAGKCPFPPPPSKKQLNYNQIFYDGHVWPLLSKQKRDFPKVISVGGKSLTVSANDYEKIDAMARTVYGEMASCMADQNAIHGMIVAKVILNREKLIAVENNMKVVFEKDHEHNIKCKSRIAKVTTAPGQFSIWNMDQAKKSDDDNILRTLCPSSPSNNKKFWDGNPATPSDARAWEKAMRIATEAILYPEEFNRKTKNITQYYYTSGISMSSEDGYVEQFASIQGEKPKSRCIRLWKAPKQQRLPNPDTINLAGVNNSCEY